MKVERKESEFKPIVITLESQEEAEHLWNITNCAASESLVDYDTHDYGKGNNLKKINSFKYNLWNLLNDAL
jgi:hypothetical protein